MVNASNNLANNIRIIDQINYIGLSDHQRRKVNDLTAYGVSIYTVLIEDSIFIPPHGEQKWRTNFGITRNKDDTYQWLGSTFYFTHAIVYEFSDIANSKKYIGKFEFDININVDIYNQLHFFLWNSSNSIITQ